MSLLLEVLLVRHVIRDEILNFSFFGLNYHKRAKMCGSLIIHGSIVYESLKKNIVVYYWKITCYVYIFGMSMRPKQ